ncbi:carbohydrate ABC transporter permease [Faecalicatena orotica]|uniref:carbohydrate ABC transporter permease n=1 Tax=Faecalicatena orotica TaxID=1544 RepID=UPI0032166290
MRKNKWNSYLYILPAVAFVSVFLIYPILFNLISSFTKWKGLNFSAAEFVGLQNYAALWKDTVFRNDLKNCIFFMVLTLFFQMSIGLLLTVLLNMKLAGHRFLETVYFFPVVLSSVVIGYTFSHIFEPNFGALNTFLQSVGLSNLKRMWIGDPKYAIYAILIANIYQWAGMGIIYYRAGLAGISKDIYDAAKIDGAGFWQSFFKITIPLLKNIHVIILLMGTIGCLKFFDLAYIMTSGGPANSTEFPLLYLYRKFMRESNSGLASAVAIIIIILATLMSAGILKITGNGKEEGEL